jgi:tetratricopeptide (TPR) repeat protein
MINKSSIVLITTLLSASLFSNTVFADEKATDETMTDEQAQEIFERAMEERDSGKVYDAIEKFQYILSRRPSLNRARLELAVSYHRANEYEDALREFQAVLDDPVTPEKVRLAILAYIGQLTSDEEKPQAINDFSYYVKAGVMYNTNINFAPLRGTDYIPAGQDTESPGVDTFISASHRYRDNKPFDIAGAATNFEWQSQVSWTGNNYTRSSDYDLNIISASTGPAFISTGRWNGAISVQIDQTYFGDSTLGTFVSLNPLLTFDLGNYQGLTFELSYTDNNFVREQDLTRDGSTLLGGMAYSTLLGGVDDGLEAGFRLTDHSADDDQFGYTSEEIYFGGFITFAKTSNVYLNMNFLHYLFDAPDQLASSPPTTRDENEQRYVLGYNYDISRGFLKSWTLNTHVFYTRNNSNVEYYTYERTIFAVNLNRYFM